MIHFQRKGCRAIWVARCFRVGFRLSASPARGKSRGWQVKRKGGLDGRDEQSAPQFLFCEQIWRGRKCTTHTDCARYQKSDNQPNGKLSWYKVLLRICFHTFKVLCQDKPHPNPSSALHGVGRSKPYLPLPCGRFQVSHVTKRRTWKGSAFNVAADCWKEMKPHFEENPSSAVLEWMCKIPSSVTMPSPEMTIRNLTGHFLALVTKWIKIRRGECNE